MSNTDDKDPFAPRDATILRPRPGAGRRATTGREAEPVTPSQSPPAARSREAPPAAIGEFVASGLNPLLQAASPLLVLAGRVRSTLAQQDIAGLKRQILQELRTFEDRARTAGVPAETVVAARYALCATLDEAVLSTPWGAQSDWGAQTLLVTLHRETWGGEKFFEMLERISRDPARHIDLMELQYVCLAVGFAGKFQVLERGHVRLAEIQNELYRRIKAYRGAPAGELSPRWRGVEDRRNPLIRYVPWWVLAACALVLLSGTFIFFHARLGHFSVPVSERLARVGLADFAEAAPVALPVRGPRLKELLAEDAARGVLSVEEEGARTVVTLIARDLFASGSVRVNPAYFDSLRNVAHALNQVPGRVLVVGHTDDQPLRSLRFRDNYELSRERAVQVVELLKLAIDQPARLEWTGVGSSEPRYLPESLPENRARNRRVEIIHVDAGQTAMTGT